MQQSKHVQSTSSVTY